MDIKQTAPLLLTFITFTVLLSGSAVAGNGANFEVNITSPEDSESFVIGDTITVNYTINNTGDDEGTQNITFNVTDETESVYSEIEETKEIEEGVKYEGNFTWETTDEDSGSYDINVSSEDDYDDVLVNLQMVETLDAEDVTNSSVRLHGNLKGMGGEDEINVSFRYREEGVTDWDNTSKENVTEVGEFNKTVTGLENSTNYEYKAVAEWDDKNATGDTLNFTTHGDVELNTLPAENVTNESATLKGEIEAIYIDEPVNVSFRWREEGEDWEENKSEDNVSEGEFNSTVKNLDQFTSYEYKAVAEWNETNDGVKNVTGDVLSFTTTAPKPTWDEDEGVYRITSTPELQWMGENLTADYVLENDIDASETEDWYNGKGFEPIAGFVYEDGEVVGHETFNGTFDGRGHTVENLHINRTNEFFVGIFGALQEKATVKNVRFEGVNIRGFEGKGDESTGTVAGSSGGKIKDVSVGGIVRGGSAGGLVGMNSGEILSSYSSVNVYGNASEGTDGGLVALNNGSITDSYAVGDVHGNFTTGGIVGHNGLKGDGGYINRSYAAGNVTVVEGDDKAGGLVGNHTVGSVAYSYWDNETSDVNETFGVVDEDAHNESVEGLSTEEMQLKESYVGWDIVDVEEEGHRIRTHTWNIVNASTCPFLSWEETDVPHVETIGSENHSFGKATVKGEVLIPGDKDSAVASFQYRKEGEDTWQNVSFGDEIEETGQEFVYEISGLDNRTDYEFRANTTWEGGSYTGGVKDFETGPWLDIDVDDVEVEEATLVATVEKFVDEKVNLTMRYREWEDDDNDWIDEFEEELEDGEEEEVREEIDDLDEDTNYVYNVTMEWEFNDTDYSYTDEETFGTDELEEEEEEEFDWMEEDGEVAVETLEAEDIEYESAVLRGEVTELEEVDEVDAYFRYREFYNGDDWEETSGQTVDDEEEFEEEVDDLSEDTAYEFEAVVEWDDGDEESVGSTETFLTERRSPVISDPWPEDGAEGIGTDINLTVEVEHPEGKEMNVKFYNDETGNIIEEEYGVEDGEVSGEWFGLNYDETYSWYVEVHDGDTTTESDILIFETVTQEELSQTEVKFEEMSEKVEDMERDMEAITEEMEVAELEGEYDELQELMLEAEKAMERGDYGKAMEYLEDAEEIYLERKEEVEELREEVGIIDPLWIILVLVLLGAGGMFFYTNVYAGGGEDYGYHDSDYSYGEEQKEGPADRLKSWFGSLRSSEEHAYNYHHSGESVFHRVGRKIKHKIREWKTGEKQTKYNEF